MKRILLTIGSGDPSNYCRALKAAGLEAVVAEKVQNPEDFAGLLLGGGGDLDPSLYGEKNKGSRSVSAQRDALDLGCLHRFLLARKPILGICRGMQVINVAFGGSLIQHLPSAHRHIGDQGDLYHKIQAAPPLEALYGSSFLANSCHHQAINRLGHGLLPIAFSQDGCPEGLRHQSLPVIGLQFHPERMENGGPIFSYFAALCADQ